MPDIEDAILNAKDQLPEITPTPAPQQRPTSSAKALKNRLEWGEPALTIIDVRDRDAFNDQRIMGAITMPIADLPQRVLDALELRREIYVYGNDDQQTAEAAQLLRDAGFESVSELLGGLEGWKAIDGPTEGHAYFPTRLP
ncbi:MAG: rhodanese-like domain-containing protein [Chloroflexaceae bacterium]|nr:rhodanese-like domain-containing protein [Chloroflexaceae bacterium]